MAAVGTVVLAAALFAATGHRVVHGEKKLGPFFRHAIYVVPANSQFVLREVEVEFHPERKHPLRDSLEARITFSNQKLWKSQSIRFRRGPIAGQERSIKERLPEREVYVAGDTVTVSLLFAMEEYQEIHAWPRHTVRWKGFLEPIQRDQR